MNKKKKKIIISILAGFVAIVGIAGIYAYSVYQDIFRANVSKDVYLFVPTGTDYNELTDSLISTGAIQDIESFKKTASLKKYKNKIHPGRYKLNKGMTNNGLVNLLRSGKQSPVKVTFNNVRTVEELASTVSKLIEADSSEITELLYDELFIEKYNFDKQNIIGLFIPNTYEFYWNTSAEKFIDRMYKEYSKFWTEERTVKAAGLNLSKQEVSVLASIVQAEQREHNDEKAKIAGLYINRIRRGMLLQSDPTLIFASGDFTKKRVLNKDKEIESPYNTYKYAGLPPGPINMPEISSLDAVLNYESHNYIFMCAKEDFSGYHNFAVNGRQHGINARKYQQALNKKKIWK
ncbi:MAG: endolytic transglycosylase MltG [Bacteroidales bacterium]|nr:endolytic transglycosylase MltG [Bacteroidales bacterium]